MTSPLIEPYLHLSEFQIPNHPSNRRAGGHTAATTSVGKHQQDAYDDIQDSLQKEVQDTDYSYLNRWCGRSDHIATLIYFDCI